MTHNYLPALLLSGFFFFGKTSSLPAQSQSVYQVAQGTWNGSVKNGKFECWLKTNGGKEGYSISKVIFDLRELDPQPARGNGTYKIVREAGTLILKGKLDENSGSGQFTLTPDASFISVLKGRGIEVTDVQLPPQLFFANINTAYLNFLGENGYAVHSEGPLLTLATQGMGYSWLSDFLKGLKDKGYEGVSMDKLIEMRIQGVDIAYIDQLERLGYKHIPLDEIIDLKIHDVTAGYIASLQQKGYAKCTLDQYKSMRDNNFTGDERINVQVKVQVKVN